MKVVNFAILKCEKTVSNTDINKNEIVLRAFISNFFPLLLVDNRSSPALSLVHLPTTGKEPSILIGQLRMAVNVLASGTCSDEGLEDATTLLLQLSRTEPVTRDSILDLLLEAAQETVNTLRDEIQSLWFELKQYNAKNSSNKAGESSKVQKSYLRDHPFSTYTKSFEKITFLTP